MMTAQQQVDLPVAIVSRDEHDHGRWSRAAAGSLQMRRWRRRRGSSFRCRGTLICSARASV